MYYVIYDSEDRMTLVCTDKKPVIDEDAIEFSYIYWMGTLIDDDEGGRGRFSGSEKFFILVESDEINEENLIVTQNFDEIKNKFRLIAKHVKNKEDSIKAFFEKNKHGNQ